MKGDPVRALLSALVAVLAIAGAADFHRWIERYNREGHPPRIDWAREEARFREIAAIVPANARVGYVSDLPLDRLWASEQFQTARYLLAPRLVVARSSTEEWLLAASQPAGYRIVKDLGGLLLCRR